MRLGKAWDVIGFTFNGEGYCDTCGADLPAANQFGDEPQPVFASDGFAAAVCDDEGEVTFVPYNCGKCGEVIK
jgi:hypothetical protein